ncbi:hypothetical protein LQW54_010665 [Pestalotiopsis sp. IQ-011]
MDLYAVYSDNIAFISNPHHDSLRRSDDESGAPSLADQKSGSEEEDDHDRTPAPEAKRNEEFLVVTTKTEPRDTAFGFRHGRHPDSLILLGERADAVSRRQFDIKPTPTGALFIYNQSIHGTTMQLGGQSPLVLANPGDFVLIPDDQRFVNILTPVVLRIFFYHRAGRPEWAQFCAELALEVPILNNLELQSMHSTVVSDSAGKRGNMDVQQLSTKRRKVHFATHTAKSSKVASIGSPRSSISELESEHLSCRLLFQPGSLDFEARGTWVQLHRRDSVESEPVWCLAVDQTHEDARCVIRSPFSCSFSYYPFQDSVEFHNASVGDLTVESREQTAISRIKKKSTMTLAPGTWKISDISGCDFQVQIYGRQYSIQLSDASGLAVSDVSERIENNSLKLHGTLRVFDSGIRRCVFLQRHVLSDAQIYICRGILSLSNRPDTNVLLKFFKSKVLGIFHAATAWEREYSILKTLGPSANAFRQHQILPLLAVDARLGLLIFEDVSAKPLVAGRWCQSGQFSGTPGDAERILQDMTKALKRIQSIRWRHNSIRPMNVFYSRRVGAFLTGFGFASPFGHPSKAGQSFPWYVSPERLQDREDVKPDIWSLGVLGLALFRCIPLTGLHDLTGRWNSPRDATQQCYDSTQWLKFLETAKNSINIRFAVLWRAFQSRNCLEMQTNIGKTMERNPTNLLQAQLLAEPMTILCKVNLFISNAQIQKWTVAKGCVKKMWKARNVRIVLGVHCGLCTTDGNLETFYDSRPRA